MKNRHLVGAGAAACAVCCAAPILTVLGVAGAAATVATFAFAGAVFGLVVASAAVLALGNHRRRRSSSNCTAGKEPTFIDISPVRPVASVSLVDKEPAQRAEVDRITRRFARAQRSR